MSRIFITGATGYIGRALALTLKQQGHHVVALVRDSSPSETVAELEQAGVVTSKGDVTDRYSLRPGMSGADWVVHAAALVDMDGAPEAMKRVNVDGSDNVASLACKLGVGRFLSVSSMAYWGGSPPDGSPADEEAPVQPFPSPYSATKHSGELAIRQWAKQGLKVNTVFPGLVYGPPGKRSGTNALLRMVLTGRMPFLVGGDRKMSWVYVDDVVQGIVRVMERSPPGRGYLLAGEVATLGEVVRKVAALAGTKPPRFSLPVPVAKGLLRLWSAAGSVVGRRPPTEPERLQSLERHWAFDDRRARTELDWHPRGLDEGLPPTVETLTRP